ncbi:ribonuclease H-like domain-containing protein [Pavlovales sp. CCMP2436]|nr:ribonuclease H-like domain-containing protein [Pavlovales sp. CCMP2436]
MTARLCVMLAVIGAVRCSRLGAHRAGAGTVRLTGWPRARLLATSSVPRLLYFDLETTGLSKSKCRVIEIAALDPESGASFSTLVNPGEAHRIVRQVQALTGLSRADVSAPDVPSFGEALDALVAFVGEDAVLCAHNCRSFDAPFLAAEAARAGRTLPVSWRFACSLHASRTLFNKPWVPSRPARMTLDALATFAPIRARRTALWTIANSSPKWWSIDLRLLQSARSSGGCKNLLL